MAPSGGYKGVGIALMVELMAAAMSGATLGINASPFAGTVGGPPKTGQFFLAIDPNATSSGAFAERLTDLVAAIEGQDGARLPGNGRKSKRIAAASEGVAVMRGSVRSTRSVNPQVPFKMVSKAQLDRDKKWNAMFRLLSAYKKEKKHTKLTKTEPRQLFVGYES